MGDADGPAIRANMVKLSLDILRAGDPGVARDVLARVASSSIAAIDESTRVDWISAGLQMDLNDALFEVMDESAYAAFWTKVGLVSARTSIFAQIAQGAMRLFGVSPLGIYKMVPRAQALVTRGCGDHSLVADKAQKRATIVTSGIPALLRRTDSWIVSQRITLSIPMVIVHAEGRVELDRSRIDEGIATYVASWI